jgi:hypothetical protein
MTADDESDWVITKHRYMQLSMVKALVHQATANAGPVTAQYRAFRPPLNYLNKVNRCLPGDDMDDLYQVGFELVGNWQLVSNELMLNLEQMGSSSNVLYAFVMNGKVQYIGKTTQPLKSRMLGYLRPVATQSTNLRNHEYIKNALRKGEIIQIFALRDNGLMRIGPYHLNLAAGLEDSLIASFRPKWNSATARAPMEGGMQGGENARPSYQKPVSEKVNLRPEASKEAQIDLLAELSSRVGKTFVTLGQRKPFDLTAVDRSTVQVRPASTNTERSFPIKHVQATLDHLIAHGSIDLEGIRSYSEMNPVYVAALVGDLPGVTISTRPICLRV